MLLCRSPVGGSVHARCCASHAPVSELLPFSCPLLFSDPPESDPALLELLGAQPVTVKAGQTATIKIPFRGRPPPKVTWYKDGLEMLEDERTKVERTADSTTLVLSR